VSEEFNGVTAGPLHDAILEAYDKVGLVCPLVIDPDLLTLGGHHQRGA